MDSKIDNQAASDRCGMCGKSRHKLSLMGHILLPLRAAGDAITETVLNILAGLGVTTDAKLRKDISLKINGTGVPSICSVCIQSWAKEFSKDARTPGSQTTIQISDAGRKIVVSHEDEGLDAEKKDAVPANHPDYSERPLTPAEARAFRDFIGGK